MSDGAGSARRMLGRLTAKHGRAMRLGCSTVAHRDLGFCAADVPDPDRTGFGAATEVAGWRLLAMAERGIPK